MADGFQPRFVDLVRNYTITQGTGDFVLGPAVSGFSSFGAMLRPGDQFYYSAIGIDKPNEREVGRGALQADGTIARSPVAGAATDFSAGSKSVALVAAAEWFNGVQAGAGAGGGGGTAMCASRASLAAVAYTQMPVLLTEAGREGMFVFDGGNLAAKVTADPAQGVYVAPSSDPSGASGAWVRRFTGAINAGWFGAAPSASAAANGAAIQAAVAFAKTLGVANYGYTSSAAELVLPVGVFSVDRSIDIAGAQLLIRGAGGDSAGGTVLKFPAGKSGFRVQGNHTTGDDVYAATAAPGGHLILRDVMLVGAYTTTEGEWHGINCHGGLDVANVYITGFQGDGIAIKATAGSTNGAYAGNANNWTLTKVLIEGCRNGLYVGGDDVNAGGCYASQFNANRQWGVSDNSYLGNAYTQCHTASNGAGPYMTNNANQRSAFVNCYSEGGQPTSQFSGRTIVVGGLHEAGVGALGGGTYGGWITGTTSGVSVPGWLQAYGPDGAVMLADRGGSSNSWALYTENGGDMVFYCPGQPLHKISKSGAFVPSRITTTAGQGGTTTGSSAGALNFGYGGTESYRHSVVSRHNGGGVSNNALDVYLFKGGTDGATDAPSNLIMTLDGQSGLTVLGGGLGYGAGAGGAAVQATSKSTGVTLNALSGQITLNAASLPASISVGFTLTNSKIAATDTVIVNIGSGATAASYVAAVDAVAAGSCRISLRNVSAAALAEAVVLNFAVLKAVAA